MTPLLQAVLSQVTQRGPAKPAVAITFATAGADMNRALTRWRGEPWLGPEVLVAALAMILVEAKFITRGVGLFLIVFFTVPILWLVTRACIAWSVTWLHAGRTRRSRSCCS